MIVTLVSTNVFLSSIIVSTWYLYYFLIKHCFVFIHFFMWLLFHHLFALIINLLICLYALLKLIDFYSLFLIFNSCSLNHLYKHLFPLFVVSIVFLINCVDLYFHIRLCFLTTSFLFGYHTILFPYQIIVFDHLIYLAYHVISF